MIKSVLEQMYMPFKPPFIVLQIMFDSEIAHQKLVKCPKQYSEVYKQLFTLETLTTIVSINFKNSKSNETGCIALA